MLIHREGNDLLLRVTEFRAQFQSGHYLARLDAMHLLDEVIAALGVAQPTETFGSNEVTVEGGIYVSKPRKTFADLRAQMSPESQARAAERTTEVIAALGVASAPHRCSGCGHHWEGDTTVGELCGDCWRKAQPALGVAERVTPTPTQQRMEPVAQMVREGRLAVQGVAAERVTPPYNFSDALVTAMNDKRWQDATMLLITKVDALHRAERVTPPAVDVARIIDAIDGAIAFLDCTEWNNRNSEESAGDVQHELEDVRAALHAAPDAPQEK